MLSAVISQYGFMEEGTYSVAPFGSGLINNTWLVGCGGKRYILQRINQNVFKTPENIDGNIANVAGYLKQHAPQYFFPVPLQTADGRTLVNNEHGAFRLFAFIEGSHTYDALQKPAQAYEAAKQFGIFTQLTAGFEAARLKITLPDFHNLSLRYMQYQNAVANGNKVRAAFATELVRKIDALKDIVNEYEQILRNPAFKKRVTHHDTKISNVLFDENDKGICVIDLDTVMPGYFVSDVGDMMRTYLAAATEEETDFTKIFIRDQYFEAVMEGYLGEMRNELNREEVEAFVYAGKFMIYMQALRFMTDFLNNDIYYGAKYDLHNYNRAANQMVLLEQLFAKEEAFKRKVKLFVRG